MKAKLKFKGKELEFSVKKVKGIKKFIGLMFNKKGKALLFEFKKETRQPIHSFFCPDFLAIWINKEGKIIDYKFVVPNTPIIKPGKKFIKLIEIPINDENKEVIKIFIKDIKRKNLNTTQT